MKKKGDKNFPILQTSPKCIRIENASLQLLGILDNHESLLNFFHQVAELTMSVFLLNLLSGCCHQLIVLSILYLHVAKHIWSTTLFMKCLWYLQDTTGGFHLVFPLGVGSAHRSMFCVNFLNSLQCVHVHL